MPNTLYDSFLNPIKFHKLDNIQPANYLSRFMDDWAFRRTIQPWQEKVCFYQLWSNYDSVNLQYTSNIGPIVLKLYDEVGSLKSTQAFNDVMQDELQPTFYIRQIAFSMSGYDPGRYFFVREIAGSPMYSEPIEIIDVEDSGIYLENQDPTLYLEYSHYEPIQGIKWFTPFEAKIRIPGILQFKQPGAKDNIYEDQLLNMTLINSVPYRIWQLILGGNRGVPPWFVDRIARVLSLSNVSIDGRLYTKNEGASFEPSLLDAYPMAGWVIDLREKLNRDTQIIEDDLVIEGIAAAAIIMDNKGFGIDGGDTEYSQINFIQ